MPMLNRKYAKRVRNKLPMVTPGTRDNSILPSSGGASNSGITLDYSAINMGGIDNGVAINHADDEKLNKRYWFDWEYNKGRHDMNNTMWSEIINDLILLPTSSENDIDEWIKSLQVRVGLPQKYFPILKTLIDKLKKNKDDAEISGDILYLIREYGKTDSKWIEHNQFRPDDEVNEADDPYNDDKTNNANDIGVAAQEKIMAPINDGIWHKDEKIENVKPVIVVNAGIPEEMFIIHTTSKAAPVYTFKSTKYGKNGRILLSFDKNGKMIVGGLYYIDERVRALQSAYLDPDFRGGKVMPMLMNEAKKLGIDIGFNPMSPDGKKLSERYKLKINDSEDGGSFVGKSEEGFALRHNLDYGSSIARIENRKQKLAQLFGNAVVKIIQRAFPDYQQYNGNPQMYEQIAERVDAFTTPHFNMWNTYYAADDEYGLQSLSSLKAILPQIAKAAQKVYDGWVQDEDDDLNGGGICHLIADAMCDEMSRIGIECATVSYSIGEVHVAAVAKLEDGVYTIDIPPSLYETGGGYTWQKRPGINFTPDFISVTKESSDPNEFEKYTADYVDDKYAAINMPQYSDPNMYEQISNPRNTSEPEFDIFETYFADDEIEITEDDPLETKEVLYWIYAWDANETTYNFETTHDIKQAKELARVLLNDGFDHVYVWSGDADGANTRIDPVVQYNKNQLNEEGNWEKKIKKAFVKMAVSYDSNQVIQDLIKIPQVKALIDQEASGFVDQIIVTSPGADVQQTQQQLKPTSPGMAPITLEPISGNPYGHVWIGEDPTTHQKKPLDKIVRIDRVTDQWGTLVTILHEIAHHRHPDWSESQVESEAENLAGTVKQYLGAKNASGKTSILFAKQGLHSLPLVQCDLADTYQKQVIGLQSHSSLRPDAGLLFTYSTPQPLTFWMGKVSFPIDIIFADSNNKIIKIYRNCKPNSTELYACSNASKVIEVVASFCAFHNIDVGDNVFYADDRDKNLTQHILQSIVEAKIIEQEDLKMTDWNIKIVMKHNPDSRRFMRVSWSPEDYKLKKADILVNPNQELMREALKKMSLAKLVRHALLHILVGAKNELKEDKEQELITDRLFLSDPTNKKR